MTPLHLLRNTGKIEAISFLVLVLIAMPLKHLAGMPEPVKIIGWIHGILFMIFCLALANAKLKTSLTNRMTLVTFIAALLPFGPFVIDGKLKHLEET